MSQLLFINWNNKDLTGYSIIDEQHRGLIATINSLYYFIQQGWDLQSLKPTILMLEQYMVFHLKTEESILASINIPEETMEAIREYRETFLQELHDIVTDAIISDKPHELSKFLAKWWQGHKTEFHEKLQVYFDSCPSKLNQ